MNKKTIILAGFILALGISIIFIAASKQQVITEGMLIVTQVSADQDMTNFDNLDDWRYSVKARIVAINIKESGNSIKILSDEFYSARSAEVKHDATKMVFSARKSENSPWQIWEMDLSSREYTQVISREENCTDPAYLPNGQIIYSVQQTDESGTVINALYACQPNGCCEVRLTHHPHADFAPTVHKDGRVLMISQQLYPVTGDAKLLVMRPDGTKHELFYKAAENTYFLSKGWETSDDRFIFVESDKNNPGKGILVSISQSRPLHSRVVHSSEIKGSFYSVFPTASGTCIVTYQKPGSENYELYEFDPLTNKLGEKIISNPDFHCIEPMVVKERPLPRKLPTGVNPKMVQGYFVCLDANFSEIPPRGNLPEGTKAQTVQVFGLKQKLIDVTVENDGSFNIEVPADTPIRFQTLDENGQIIRGPSAWVWVRPNDHRGCVGCHENREYSPENIVPIAITKKPVSLFLEKPEDLNKLGH